MIHKFEITADLEPTAAGEFLFLLSQFIEENDGKLLRFFSESERGKHDDTFPLRLVKGEK